MRIFSGFFVLAMGVVAVCVTWQPFAGLSSSGKAWGWIFLALGAITALLGWRLLWGRRSGKELLVVGEPTRIFVLVGAACVLFALFLMWILFATEPEGSATYVFLPASCGLGSALCVRGLFSLTAPPRHPVQWRIPAAYRRRSRWLVPLMFVGGMIAVLLGFAGEIWDTDEGKPGLVGAGIWWIVAAVVFAHLAWGGNASRNSEQPSDPEPAGQNEG
ncbi:hypothetical protein NBM05_08520 [Rothia sp. AR01]|uniref:Uncharacterized protein n=1 Tax=Rothia santali TaxID=2949643 RepID=A0A9X2HD16_9MICC|nr:hypothetical protein [Rothia santali]MCP3426045.1 hypothetical protein [Rothia santali]